MATNVKVIKLTGEGRDAQNEAQAIVTREFMDETAFPKYRLMANYATGVGKGKAAIETAIEFWNKVSKNPVMIGTFTEKARDNVWVAQIAQWGRMHPFTATVEKQCYASFHNITGRHFGLVILDEAQHLTELSYSFFENNQVDGVLILTATEPRNSEKKALIRQITHGRRLIIEQASAIAAGIINDFEVYVMRLQPDKNKLFKMMKNNNTLYTEWTGYLKKCQLLQQATRSGNRVRIKFAAIDRMRYIGGCETKTKAAAYIQQQFRDKEQRFLTIASSIAQADSLSIYTCHSQTHDKHYKAFLNNKLHELVSINQLKEGENFPDLGRLLLLQAANDPNEFTQITGRSLRLPIGQISRVFVLCLMGTQDETYVKNALTNVAIERIKYMDILPDKYAE